MRDSCASRQRRVAGSWHAFVARGEVRTSYASTSELGTVTSLSTNGTAASFVPPNYDRTLWASLPAIDGIVAPSNCNTIETLSGASMTTPAIDDVQGSPLVAVKSARISEAYQSSNGFVRSGGIKWSAAPTYRSQIVYCATELEQDSAFELLHMLNLTFNRRHALGFSSEVINGSGIAESGSTSTVPYWHRDGGSFLHQHHGDERAHGELHQRFGFAYFTRCLFSTATAVLDSTCLRRWHSKLRNSWRM